MDKNNGPSRLNIEVSEYDSLSVDISNLECLIEQYERNGWGYLKEYTRMFDELEALKAKRDALPKPDFLPYKQIAMYAALLLVVAIFSWAVTSQYTIIKKTYTYEETLASGEVVTRTGSYLYDEWFGSPTYIKITKYGKRITGTYTALDRFLDLFCKTLAIMVFLNFGYVILKYNRIEDGSEQPIGQFILGELKTGFVTDAKKQWNKVKTTVARNLKH